MGRAPCFAAFICRRVSVRSSSSPFGRSRKRERPASVTAMVSLSSPGKDVTTACNERIICAALVATRSAEGRINFLSPAGAGTFYGVHLTKAGPRHVLHGVG